MNKTTCLRCNNTQYNFETYFFLNFPLNNVRQYAFNKMCTSDNFYVNNLRIMLRYVNKKNMDELKKMVNNYQEKFINNVREFSKNFYHFAFGLNLILFFLHMFLILILILRLFYLNLLI